MKAKVDWLLANAFPDGECLICHLTPNAKGYCNISFGRQIKWRAHRLVCHVINGPVEVDKLVRHTCDNRACINPKHLVVGTARDNTNDMIERGRAKFATAVKGSSVYHDKILSLYNQGLSRQEIANKLYISTSTVWNHTSKKGLNYE